MSNGSDAQAPEANVMETASATTSPDNANSGNFAYILFAVVIALVVLSSLAVSSCTSVFADAFSYVDSNGMLNTEFYDDYNTYSDELGELGEVTIGSYRS